MYPFRVLWICNNSENTNRTPELYKLNEIILNEFICKEASISIYLFNTQRVSQRERVYRIQQYPHISIKSQLPKSVGER